MVVHSAAQYELFTGRVLPGYPSMGSWVLYGLGTESQSLPGYVVMPDPHGALEGGPADVHQRLSAGRLPADHVSRRRPPGAQPRSAGRRLAAISAGKRST